MGGQGPRLLLRLLPESSSQGFSLTCLRGRAMTSWRTVPPAAPSPASHSHSDTHSHTDTLTLTHSHTHTARLPTPVLRVSGAVTTCVLCDLSRRTHWFPFLPASLLVPGADAVFPRRLPVCLPPHHPNTHTLPPSPHRYLRPWSEPGWQWVSVLQPTRSWADRSASAGDARQQLQEEGGPRTRPLWEPSSPILRPDLDSGWKARQH